MNERIKELAKQADNYAYKMNPEQDSYGRSANPRKFQQDRDAKFAELIIRKCADIALQKGMASPDTDFRTGSYVINQYLLVHFGVEE
jgi:hypothetical protein